MKIIPITRVRLTDAEGRDALNRYVFAGRYGGIRVPRGIEPRVVAQFLRETLVADAEPNAFARANDVMRFYESAEVLPHLREVLKAPDRGGGALVRGAHIIPAIG